MKKRPLATASLVAYTYVGTVVGAGFASGQEIMSFFTIYGSKSFFAILISSILFIVVGIQILLLGMEFSISSFGELIKRMFGVLSPFVNTYLLFAMMVINISMLAGAGALFEEFGKTSYFLGVTITASIAIFTIFFGIKGILAINKVVVLGILSFQILMLILTLKFGFLSQPPKVTMEVHPIFPIYKGLNYASFNLMLSSGVLTSLGCEFRDKKVLKLGGFLGGCILGLMLFITHYCLSVHIPEIFEFEIPMLYIINALGIPGGTWLCTFIYALMLWGGIFTTLIGNLFSMTSFLEDKYRLGNMVWAVIIICLGIILAPLGFSVIVSTLYPILGVVGIVFILSIAYYVIITKRKQRI